MEYNSYLGEAHKSVKIAEHLFTVTYPLSHDLKLLLSILFNLHKAQKYSLTALLEKKMEQKQIPILPNEYRKRLFWLQLNYDFLKLDKELVDLLFEVDSILSLHEKCPIEFVRKDRFVLCTDTYNIKTISAKEINQYLIKTKLFIDKITSNLAS